ncbi:Uncharacterised protein [Raoultella terrigena]|uniref:Uncharacterized protein n=1 Tax=Raoultella terrigena TaxID=577 RepID=A0A3P8JRH7_RAOTE|nr:Uncharacterised protein [Raoultella terrigena]
MQFTAPVAADRHQSHVANRAEAVLHPQALQQLVDKLGAGFNQPLGGGAGIESLPQPALEKLEMGLNRRAVQIVLRPGARILRLAREGRGESVR